MLAKVQEVVNSYLAVGQALEVDGPIPFSPRVQRSATGVRRLLEGQDGFVESIRFETEEDDVTIERTPPAHPYLLNLALCFRSR